MPTWEKVVHITVLLIAAVLLFGAANQQHFPLFSPDMFSLCCAVHSPHNPDGIAFREPQIRTGTNSR